MNRQYSLFNLRCFGEIHQFPRSRREKITTIIILKYGNGEWLYYSLFDGNGFWKIKFDGTGRKRLSARQQDKTGALYFYIGAAFFSYCLE